MACLDREQINPNMIWHSTFVKQIKQIVNKKTFYKWIEIEFTFYLFC